MSIISDCEYILNETYYVFSDKTLTNAYMKYILKNSGNFEEAMRKIKRIQDRVITLSNYANDGLIKANDFEDSNLVCDNENFEPDFEQIDEFYKNDSAFNSYGEYLQNETPANKLSSTIRQCESIRVTSNIIIKKAKNFYFFRNLQHTKNLKQIKPLKQNISNDFIKEIK